LSKESPCHRVQQRGFSGPIGTGDTGQVETGEIQFDRIAIREESRKSKVKGDHEIILPENIPFLNLQAE
jgi:hypothetical protein